MLLQLILLCDNKFAISNDWRCAIFINVSRPLCVSLVLSCVKFSLSLTPLFHIIQSRFNFKIQLIWQINFVKDEYYVQFISISLLVPSYFDFIIMFTSLIFINCFRAPGYCRKCWTWKPVRNQARKTNFCCLSTAEIRDIL